MADQEAKKAAKPAVVKKKKPSKPKTPAAHPTYNEMIRAAIVALAERNGSSRQAIQKYIFANYKVGDPQKARVHIKVGLKRMEASGLLKHTKGKGASGSFKLGEKAKKPVKTKKAAAAAAKKPAAKKPAAKKPATKKKSPTKAKKPAAKKAAKKSAKKAKPEKKASKPKKAKSPAKKKSKSKSPSKKKSAKKAAKK